MRNVLLLFNPHAGKGKINAKLSAITDILTKEGFLVTAYPTQDKGDAREKILQWGSSYDRIIVAGGDGMLHEAINGVMNLETRIDFGYIPSGTVNDFANSTKIPKTIEQATKVAAGETRQTIDVGRFGNEYFSYVAAFGAITDIPYTTNQDAKNAFGFMAYFFNALKYMDIRTLLASCKKMEIITDTQVLTGEFLVGCISNSRTIGSLKQLVPDDVELKDGLLEGLFVQKPTNLAQFSHAMDLLVSGNMDNPEIFSIKSTRFEIKTDEDTRWTLDGEDGGVHRDILIQDCKQGLTMILP